MQLSSPIAYHALFCAVVTFMLQGFMLGPKFVGVCRVHFNENIKNDNLQATASAAELLELDDSMTR